MSLTVVVNTNCLDPDAAKVSSGGVPYADRAWFLRTVLLPAYTHWFSSTGIRRIVVAGIYEPGEGYDYLHVPQVYGNCADALVQRDAAFTAAQPDTEWVLFQHDDHLWDPWNVVPAHTGADVLAPSRWTRARGAEEALNDGNAKGHLNGHACLMRPGVFRAGFRWTKSPPVFTWDVEVTKLLQSLHQRIVYAPDLKVWDMERGAEPWR